MATTVELENKLARLNRIGIALSSERDLDRLLDRILREAREFTGADAGRLYGLSKDHLQLLASQPADLDKGPRRRIGHPETQALTPESMAGYAGLTGRAINIENTTRIPDDRPYRLDTTMGGPEGNIQSVLVVPMKEPDGTVIGVLALANARSPIGEAIPFDRHWEALVESLASQAAVALRNVRLTEELKEAYLDTVFRLSVAAEYKDGQTASHIRRVAHYAALIAEGLGFGPEYIDMLRYAAPMHDIGKIAIREEVLLKPDRLTPAEFEEMKQHTVLGAALFKGSQAPVLQMSAAIALSHHEHYDGSGYPQGLRGDEIPIEGQITALADVFDALASDRPYKSAYPIEQCIDMLQEQQSRQFRPDLIQALLERMEEVLIIRETYSGPDLE